MASTAAAKPDGSGRADADPGAPATVIVRPTGWRRWGAYVVLTVVFAVACVGLGVWQFERRAEAVKRIELIQENYDASPLSLRDGLSAGAAWQETMDWHPITVTGRYLTDEQVLVRNRSLEGNAGFEILVPLVTASGDIFVVDRGWIAQTNRGDAPAVVPEPPSGEVTVEARLRPSERTPAGQSAAKNLVPVVDLPTLAQRWQGSTITTAYGLMMSESPSAVAGKSLPKPSTSEGNHLSYAFQWIAFALLGVFALLWAIRRERRIAVETHPDGGSSVIATDAIAHSGKRSRGRRHTASKSDAEIEDALIDAR